MLCLVIFFPIFLVKFAQFTRTQTQLDGFGWIFSYFGFQEYFDDPVMGG